MPKKISLENQTRLGIGASALFVILSWLMSFFSLWVSVPILLVCSLAGFWGLRPFIPVMLTKGREHWNGTLSRYAPPAGFALLGIGVGVAVANGWHVINFAPNTGRINWNLEETASGRGVFLSLQKFPEVETRVVGFVAHGKNNSAEPIIDFEGFMRSDITNETIPLYIVAAAPEALNICTPPMNTPPKDTLGIPGFADFDIVSFEKPLYLNVLHDGPSLATFQNSFVPFTLGLRYDGKTYTRHYTKGEVDKQVAVLTKLSGPLTAPHVVRKTPPPPLTLPPLGNRVAPPPASPVPLGALRPAEPNDDVTGSLKSD
jgi:hypothetical protein